MKKIEVLFFGVIATPELLAKMLNFNIGNPNLASQKYHRLLLEGLAWNSEFNIQVISFPEFYHKNVTYGYSEYWKLIKYRYLYYQPRLILKFIINVIESFNIVLSWKIKTRNCHQYIMFDVLNLYSASIAISFSKLFGIKSITTITDLPQYMYILKDQLSLRDKITYKIQNRIISFTNIQICLTKSIEDFFSGRNKRQILIEGLVDCDNGSEILNFTPVTKKIIHYSGGLFEKFGVKALIEAFMRIDDNNVLLHLFGNGDLISFIEDCTGKDNRIKYFGYKENSIILKDQLSSFLLVNPRFSHDEYTKFSFPSKTVEYMMSGIPLLTNKLPGIPDEYFKFVFLFEEENVEGYFSTLMKLLNIPRKQMLEFGAGAQSFVYKNKNNRVQAMKLYNVL